MRWGLISDVHANAPALEAVLKDLHHRGVWRILCAGDVVGYYPFPNETIAMLAEAAVQSIRGNHDRSVLHTDPTRMNAMARDAAEWTAAQLTQRSRSYLASLPDWTTIRNGRNNIEVHHGSPRDPVEYVFEDEAGEHLLEGEGYSVLVLGHTHIPFVKKYSHGMVVNPGSVGQPRDGDPRASYSILDLAEREVINYRLEYDIAAVARRVDEVGLPRMLRVRLNAGL